MAILYVFPEDVVTRRGELVSCRSMYAQGVAICEAEWGRQIE